MNNHTNKTANVHIYRPKRETIALNIFSLGFVWIVLGVPFIMLVMMLVSSINSASKLDTFMTFLTCMLTPIVILLGFNLIQITINLVLSLFSYVKVSPDGIEEKYSLYRHIRCNWSDVQKIGKSFLFMEVLYLSSYEILGTSLSLKSPFGFLRPKQAFISLSGYEGWSDGQFANDLKQYAPQLFAIDATHQESQPEIKDFQIDEKPSISPEVRLLAAISHASVLLTNIGFLIPIGIYLTQKKKSSYLGFQSLQASIWQFAMVAFTMLTSVCLVGTMFIPALLTTSSQNEKLLESSSGSLFIVIIINIVLMFFGNLAFIIYGIVGTVKTYQGKAFRYVFIGDYIEKSKGTKPTNRA